MPDPQTVSPQKTLSFYIPNASSNLALKVIREFFLTESEACIRAKEIADILSTNKNVFKNKLKNVDEVIQLYNNLFINFFDLSSDFFKQNRLNADKNSVEDWVRSIHCVVSFPGYQRRLELLKNATTKYLDWNETVAEIIASKTLPAKTARTLQQNFSVPIFRIVRMNMLFVELKKQYTGKDEKTVKQLGHLIDVFTTHATHLNACVDNSETNDQLPSSEANIRDSQRYTRRRHAQRVPEVVVQHCREKESSANKEIFLQSLENYSKNNSLTSAVILHELKKITPDPEQQLITLEYVYGRIRPASTPSGKRIHLFRKDLLYTNVQLKQIALLKSAYLAIVANTPRVAGSEFEQYLEREYPQEATANDGGLLAFNTTCVSWFVKTEEKTTSMKQLEDLKAGIGRINPDHERHVATKIAAYGRIVY